MTLGTSVVPACRTSPLPTLLFFPGPPGQEHFAATGPRKTAAQIAAQQADLMAKLPQGTSIDSRVLDVATSLHMVGGWG